MMRRIFSFLFKREKTTVPEITADTIDTVPPDRLREIDQVQTKKETKPEIFEPKDDGSETIKTLVGQKISARILAKTLNTQSRPKSAAALRESRLILRRIGLKFETCPKNPKMVRVVTLS